VRSAQRGAGDVRWVSPEVVHASPAALLTA
jgi:hypothetical protein